MKSIRQIMGDASGNFSSQMTMIIVPLNIAANTMIISYCAYITRLPINYTMIQKLILVFLTVLITLISELLFHHVSTKPLSNNLTFWKSTGISEKEKTVLLESLALYPQKRAFQILIIFFLNGLMYSSAGHFLLNATANISVFYFHLFISFSYFYIMITMFIVENECSKIATEIVSQGIELSEKKFFGLSQKQCFQLYIVIPMIIISLIAFHTIYYAFTPKTIYESTGSVVTRVFSETEKAGYFVKMRMTKDDIFAFAMRITGINTISFCTLIYFYFARINNSTKLMQNSLVVLKNKKIDMKNLFEVNMFSEVSYTMHLINKTILLFDSIIRNNAKTNHDIDNASENLSLISKQTKDNVIQQSANIEEILATMQSVDNLSKKIENSFDEVITVASKTVDRVDFTFSDINENLSKIQELTSTNRITIDNLKILSAKITGIQEVINTIDKIAEQIKTVAFNAELEANKLDVKGIDFNNVAEEIRMLSNSTLDLTRKIHLQIAEITESSENLISTGNYCMQKTEEGNEICISMEKMFEEIKKSAHETSVNSSSIKETLHEQTNAFHQIVETLSQIAKSVRNFGTSSTEIAETIEKLRENSSHIHALNNKYNNQDNIQEGTAI